MSGNCDVKSHRGRKGKNFEEKRCGGKKTKRATFLFSYEVKEKKGGSGNFRKGG